MPSIIFNTNRKNISIVAQGKYFPSLKEIIMIATTFSLTVLAWVFFRAENITHAFCYLSTVFSKSLFKVPSIEGGISNSFMTISFIIALMLIEWLGRNNEYALGWKGNSHRVLKWAFLFILTVFILENFNRAKSQEFIYFDF